MRLVHITTVPLSLKVFFPGQFGFMKQQGFEIHAISSPGPLLTQLASEEQIPVHAVPMTRRITPFRDLVALARLWWILVRLRPVMVHAHTPKGGLLGTLAAWLARVPVRIYHIHGFPFMTAPGWRGRLLRWTEQLSCRFATQVLCVSPSVCRVAAREGICPAEKIKVLGRGSCNGVDAAGRFNPAQFDAGRVCRIRAGAGIPADALVVGFVGRLVRDKGLVELVEAWRVVREEYPHLWLLMVGPKEQADASLAAYEALLEADPRVHFTGMVSDVVSCYAAMDLLILPTYREGFPISILEAAAMGLPIVATRIPGCVDAVEDGVTGTLVPPQRSADLAEAIRGYLASPGRRQTHGQAGRVRVLQHFQREMVWKQLHHEYLRLSQSDQLALSPRDEDTISTGNAFSVGPSLARNRFRQRTAKRISDVVLAAILLVVFSPVVAAIAIVGRWRLGRPILFRQVRPGLSGRPFTLYKFRTMTDDRGDRGLLRPDAERLTAWGAFLRRTSLDELPQLWNVLRGDMSLVGPRPLLLQYLERYTPRQARRLEVPPGITGWAQIHGRNAISWEQKFELDVWYVEHWSLALDLRILWLTLIKTARREGINAAGHVTMPEFSGTPEIRREAA